MGGKYKGKTAVTPKGGIKFSSGVTPITPVANNSDFNWIL